MEGIEDDFIFDVDGMSLSLPRVLNIGHLMGSLLIVLHGPEGFPPQSEHDVCTRTWRWMGVPSRTSDIAADSTFDAHSPMVLYI